MCPLAIAMHTLHTLHTHTRRYAVSVLHHVVTTITTLASLIAQRQALTTRAHQQSLMVTLASQHQASQHQASQHQASQVRADQRQVSQETVQHLADSLY